MKPKIIALALSDLHAHEWRDNYIYKGDRLEDSLKALKLVYQRTYDSVVPILFTGDLVHNPKSISNKLFSKLTDILIDIKVPLIGIDGNHDQSEKNTDTHKSPSYFETFSKLLPNLYCVNHSAYRNKDIQVVGIPYLTHNIGFKEELKACKTALSKSDKLKILLIHTDLPGAKNGFGFEVNEHRGIPKDLDKFFKGFDLVLSGHIHKPQQLGKKVFMLGSPYQQNAGDKGIEMGYWEIYSDATVKFIPLKLPQYKDLKYGETVTPNDFDIWIPQPKPVTLANTSKTNFSNKGNKTQIAKSYLKTKGIKSKRKKKALIKLLNNDNL